MRLHLLQAKHDEPKLQTLNVYMLSVNRQSFDLTTFQAAALERTRLSAQLSITAAAMNRAKDARRDAQQKEARRSVTLELATQVHII